MLSIVVITGLADGLALEVEWPSAHSEDNDLGLPYVQEQQLMMNITVTS